MKSSTVPLTVNPGCWGWSYSTCFQSSPQFILDESRISIFRTMLPECEAVKKTNRLNLSLKYRENMSLWEGNREDDTQTCGWNNSDIHKYVHAVWSTQTTRAEGFYRYRDIYIDILFPDKVSIYRQKINIIQNNARGSQYTNRPPVQSGTIHVKSHCPFKIF